MSTKINKLTKRTNLSIEEAAFYLAKSISVQTKDKSTMISLENFMFENSPMGSLFSLRLKSALEQKLIQLGVRVSASIKDENTLILTGTYWEEPENLKVIALLRDQKSSELISSSECFISIEKINNLAITYLPVDYKNALIKEQLFAKNDVVGGNMNIEIWTNKGEKNLIYTEGDILKLFIRVNKECYVRVVYHLADGQKVLLLDNYYINQDKVNKVYELPYTFECAAPFGIETLQLNAQATAFPSLGIKPEHGYDFITNDLAELIVNTRGFKKVASTNEEELRAEKRLVFTTMLKL